jgi:hypothetical protein
MERRELLKTLAIVPFTRLPFKVEEVVDAVEIAPHKYWVFVDAQRIDDNAFESPWPWPGCDAEIFYVKGLGGKSVQDAVAIYKIGEAER